MYDSKEAEIPVTTASIQTGAVAFVYSTTNEVRIHKSPRLPAASSSSSSLEEMKIPEDHINTPVISNRPPRSNPPLIYLPLSAVSSKQQSPKHSSDRTDSHSARFSSAQDDPIVMSAVILEEWRQANGISILHSDNRRRLYATVSERLPAIVDLLSSSSNNVGISIAADMARFGLESMIRLAITVTKNQIKRSLYQNQGRFVPLKHFHPSIVGVEGGISNGPWSCITRQAFGLAPSKPHSTSRIGQFTPAATVVGIPNYGQTCFFNAVIQAMAALEPLRAYLECMVRLNVEQRQFWTSSLDAASVDDFVTLDLNHAEQSSGASEPFLNMSKPMLCQSLLHSLQSVNGQSRGGARVDPRSILSMVGQKYAQFRRRFGLVTGEQQDAQELLQAILGMIIDEGQFELTPPAVPSKIVSSFAPETEEEDAATMRYGPLESTFLKRDLLGNTPLTKAMEIMMTTSSSISPCPLSVWCGSAIICASCRRARPIQNVPFLDIPIIPLAISRLLSPQEKYAGRKGVMESSCRLEDCLEEFTCIERVQDVECRNCTIQAEIQYYESDKAVQLQIIQGLESRRNKSSSTHEGNISDSSNECKVVREELRAIEARIDKLLHLSPDDDTPIFRERDDDNDCLDSVMEIRKPIVLKRSDAFKCLLLTRLPAILSIHVQRRYFDPASGKTSKTMQHVAFPEMLDVAPYCAYGGAQRPNAPFAGSLRGEGTTTHCPIWYKIMAVIEHRGGPYSGHYVCYRRDPSASGRDRWFWISDDNVRVCQWADVRRCQAYMLFYEAT